MRNTISARLLSLFLVALLLLGCGGVTAFADTATAPTSEPTGTASAKSSDFTLEELKELLNTKSYEEYLKRYEGVADGTKTVEVDVKTAASDPVRAVNAADYPDVTVTPWLSIEKSYDHLDEILAKLTYDTYSVVYDYPEEADAAKRAFFYIRCETKADKKDAVYLPESGVAEFKFNVPESGMYSIVLEGYPVVAKSANIERMLMINGKVAYSEARSISMTKTWTNLYYAQYGDNGELLYDTNGNIAPGYRRDLQGNDIRAEALQTPRWFDYTVTDSSGYYSALTFYFEKGENTIALSAEREPMVLRAMRLVPPDTYDSYDEYLKNIEGKASENSGAEPIYIPGEFFTGMSDESIYGYNNRTSSATLPQTANSQWINVVGGSSNYKTAGQWITYSFVPEKSGYYNIVARFRQADLAGMFTSRTIKINGEVLFEEATKTRFDYSSDWQLKTLGDGENDFVFWFEGGKPYTVELEVSLGELADTIREVEESLSVINDCYLEILKLTGAEPNEYQDYGFTRLMPEVLVNFVKEYRRLDRISKEMTELCGEKGAHVATLDKVAFLINNMGTDESQIAKSLKTLKSYIGTLGTWLNDSRTQPVMLDYLLIVPEGTNPKDIKKTNKEYKADGNFFESAGFEIKLFIQSFFTDYSNLGATAVTDADPVEVWISEGRDQALIIRNLVDSNFTPKTDIAVNVKLVAAGTLLPSVLSGLGPDAFIGIDATTTINYAIRSAVLPLNDFEGFDEICTEFTEAAMIPLTLEGKSYGLPERMGFSMMFYREDILADLGIEIPRTWDDVLSALPILQANNMQIGLAREYYMFLYQMGGDRWADNGMRCGLNTNVALEAFEYYCNFYTMYSFPVTYDASNRFRTGEMPIVIGHYTAIYNTLTCFATEIQGLWGFTVLPGVMREDGTINNDAIASVTGLVMLSSSAEDKRDNAWAFIKWFCGADAQAKYSNNLITTIGNAAKHPTANIKALAEMPWSTEELNSILEQFDHTAAITSYPGSYIFERYINFAFYAAYNDDEDPVEAIRSYVTTIDKEITRKREEFGMPTLELGETLADRDAAEASDGN